MSGTGEVVAASPVGRAVLVCPGCGAGHSLFTVELVTVLYPVVVVAGTDEISGDRDVEIADHRVGGPPSVSCLSEDPGNARGAWYTGGQDHRTDESSWPGQEIQCRACGWAGPVGELTPAATAQWSYHVDAAGSWCRWSLTSTSARGDDVRCPAGCPSAEVELIAGAEL